MDDGWWLVAWREVESYDLKNDDKGRDSPKSAPARRLYSDSCFPHKTLTNQTINPMPYHSLLAEFGQTNWLKCLYIGQYLDHASKNTN